MTLRYLMCLLVTFCFPLDVHSQSAAADGAVVEDKKNIVKQLEPFSKILCELESPTKFSMSIKGSANELLSIEIGNCRISNNIAGVTSVSAEVVVDLNESADVQLCQTARISHLLQLSSANADFEWPSHRVLLGDLAIKNLSDNTRDISQLSLHGKHSGKEILLREALNGNSFQHSYDDLFWGNIVVFEEPEGAEFSRLLKSKLHRAGTKRGMTDYILKLSLKAFQPRGVCSYQTEVDSDGAKTINNEFIFLESKSVRIPN